MNNVGKIVIVRTQAAGVHVGRLSSRHGSTVVLRDAVRVWRWRGANTLHELSLRGAAEEWTRISEHVDRITVLGVLEILPVTTVAAVNLLRSRWES